MPQGGSKKQGKSASKGSSSSKPGKGHARGAADASAPAGKDAQQTVADDTTFGGSRSMRENYQDLGVDNYYQEHGATYRNPHFSGIVIAAAAILDVWWAKHVVPSQPSLPTVDLGTAAVSSHRHAGAQAERGTGASQGDSAATAQNEGHNELQPSAGEEAEAAAQADKSAACDTGAATNAHEEGGAGQQPQRHTAPRAPQPVAEACAGYGCGPQVRVLDLACGAGEATQAVEGWWASRGGAAASRTTIPNSNDAGRQGQQQQPVELLPATLGGSDDSEHPPQVWAQALAGEDPPEARLAALTGDADAEELVAGIEAAQQAGSSQPATASTLFAQDVFVPPPSATGLRLPLGLRLAIDAADPFTGEAYRTWTGRAAEPFTFQDVGAGLLADEGRSYHLVICSYAMHVLDASFLFPTLQQLALVAGYLLILAPHKLPRVEERMGWELVEHVVLERVHARLYRSNMQQYGSDLVLLPDFERQAGGS